jgi:hypothetical protein
MLMALPPKFAASTACAAGRPFSHSTNFLPTSPFWRRTCRVEAQRRRTFNSSRISRGNLAIFPGRVIDIPFL